MVPELFILMIALAVALAAYGATQWVLAFLDGDRQRLAQRLTSDWRADMEALRKRNLTVETDVKGVPLFVAKLSFAKKLNRKLLSVYPQATFGKFFLLMAGLGLTFGTLLGLLMSSPGGFLFGTLGGSYLPVLFINQKRSKKQRLLADQLPEALDFLVRILRAGHSLSTAIQMMGEEIPSPIGPEFRRCYDQHSLGQPLEDCLRETAGRIESSEFAFFVTSVLIQRTTGGDLSEVLGNLSATVRARIRLQQHVKAITSEGRFTGYILVAFPVVLFLLSYVLNPQYAGVLLTDEMGKMLVAVAVMFQCIGLFAIRKIVNIKV